MKDIPEFQQCAQQLKALADADRLRIVSALMIGPHNVSELAAELDEEIVKISHHLGVLKHAGVVEAEKQGRYVLYRLKPGLLAKAGPKGPLACIDLGCCRLDLTESY